MNSDPSRREPDDEGLRVRRKRPKNLLQPHATGEMATPDGVQDLDLSFEGQDDEGHEN